MHMWVGIIALVAGALLCFAGYRVMRLALSVVGAWAGWLLGAWLGARLPVEGQWHNAAVWACGIAAALLAGVLAYSFYVCTVVVALGSLGWHFGAALATWAGLSGVAETVSSVVVAVALVLIGLMSGLPRLLLAVPTALIGAVGMVGGVLDLLDRVDLTDRAQRITADLVSHGVLWCLVALGLAAIGLVVQLRESGTRSLRSSYDHGR